MMTLTLNENQIKEAVRRYVNSEMLWEGGDVTASEIDFDLIEDETALICEVSLEHEGESDGH